MKIIQCEQGTADWYAARRGIPTASEFGKIITRAKGELSKQSRPYMLRLLAEKLLGETLDDIGNLAHVERGKLLEPQAVLAYEVEKGLDTLAVGFATTDDGRYGASPDRLLNEIAGGVEIKCPLPQTQLAYWFDGFEDDYKCQRQGQMLVCDLDFVDMFAYHPRLPSVSRRIPRDEPFIAKMRDALDQFCDQKDAAEERLRSTGFFDEVAASDDGWNGYLARLEEASLILGAG